MHSYIVLEKSGKLDTALNIGTAKVCREDECSTPMFNWGVRSFEKSRVHNAPVGGVIEKKESQL